MSLSFQPVRLDGEGPDREGLLVVRDGRLLAVLTCLSDIHDELAGGWFVEAFFGNPPRGRAPIFKEAEHFGDWVAGAG